MGSAKQSWQEKYPRYTVTTLSFPLSCVLYRSVTKQALIRKLNIVSPLQSTFTHVNKTEITMGQNSSMLKVDVFSPEEVQRLEKRFHKLDLDRSGSISIGEFVSVPELKENPLVKRVVEIFDSDLDGEVDFKEFVMGIAQFSKSESDDLRLQFIFRIYDMDRDGYISNGELFQVLKMMTGSNLTDQQLQQVVDKTIIYLDKDSDGKISFEEFKHVIEMRGTKSKISVDLSKV